MARVGWVPEKGLRTVPKCNDFFPDRVPGSHGRGGQGPFSFGAEGRDRRGREWIPIYKRVPGFICTQRVETTQARTLYSLHAPRHLPSPLFDASIGSISSARLIPCAAERAAVRPGSAGSTLSTLVSSHDDRKTRPSSQQSLIRPPFPSPPCPPVPDPSGPWAAASIPIGGITEYTRFTTSQGAATPNIPPAAPLTRCLGSRARRCQLSHSIPNRQASRPALLRSPRLPAGASPYTHRTHTVVSLAKPDPNSVAAFQHLQASH